MSVDYPEYLVQKNNRKQIDIHLSDNDGHRQRVNRQSSAHRQLPLRRNNEVLEYRKQNKNYHAIKFYTRPCVVSTFGHPR